MKDYTMLSIKQGLCSATPRHQISFNYSAVLVLTPMIPIPGKARGVFRCTSKKCEICVLGYLQEGREFVVSNGTSWFVKCHITCHSLNVIYFLKCNYCNFETKLGKTDNLRDRTNNHRSGCRNGTGRDIFDNHVHSCRLACGVPPKEPEFLMYCLMACSDFNKLLSYERGMHLRGFDTMFKLR